MVSFTQFRTFEWNLVEWWNLGVPDVEIEEFRKVLEEHIRPVNLRKAGC